MQVQEFNILDLFKVEEGNQSKQHTDKGQFSKF